MLTIPNPIGLFNVISSNNHHSSSCLPNNVIAPIALKQCTEVESVHAVTAGGSVKFFPAV